MESFTIPCKFSKVIHRKSLKLYDFFNEGGGGGEVGEGSESYSLPIQMQLSKKQNTLFQFLVPFLESTSSFKYFEKKGDRHS